MAQFNTCRLSAFLQPLEEVILEDEVEKVCLAVICSEKLDRRSRRYEGDPLFWDVVKPYQASLQGSPASVAGADLGSRRPHHHRPWVNPGANATTGHTAGGTDQLLQAGRLPVTSGVCDVLTLHRIPQKS
jgi:hypothetical protein